MVKSERVTPKIKRALSSFKKLGFVNIFLLDLGFDFFFVVIRLFFSVLLVSRCCEIYVKVIKMAWKSTVLPVYRRLIFA